MFLDQHLSFFIGNGNFIYIAHFIGCKLNLFNTEGKKEK